MTKEEFKNKIEEEISNGESILQQMVVLSKGGGNFAELRQKVLEWTSRVDTFLKSNLGELHNDDKYKFDLRLNTYRSIDTCIEITGNNVFKLKIIKECIPNIVLKSISNEDVTNNTSNNKPYKVFISHSIKDKDFVDSLVILLEFIGLKDEEKLFCFSVDGYEIPNSKNIRECLLEQFNKYRPYVIIVHSNNYYSSPYCMNEMGATWALGTDFCSLLIKGFDFDKMRGVIDNNYASIKVDAYDAKSRLNGLKDELISIFQLKGVNHSRWETIRNKFLEDVNAL